jgi:hypothetical protein
VGVTTIVNYFWTINTATGQPTSANSGTTQAAGNMNLTAQVQDYDSSNWILNEFSPVQYRTYTFTNNTAGPFNMSNSLPGSGNVWFFGDGFIAFMGWGKLGISFDGGRAFTIYEGASSVMGTYPSSTTSFFVYNSGIYAVFNSQLFSFDVSARRWTLVDNGAAFPQKLPWVTKATAIPLSETSSSRAYVPEVARTFGFGDATIRRYKKNATATASVVIYDMNHGALA